MCAACCLCAFYKQSKFLADMGIMDYSLLLGVHRRKFRLRAQVRGAMCPGHPLALFRHARLTAAAAAVASIGTCLCLAARTRT